jgi:hypothetical protein
MNKSSKLTFAALIVLAGCQTIASADDVPARITNPTDASRAALQQAVNDALHTEVLLADNALTDSSILIIERSPVTWIHRSSSSWS